MIETDYNNDLIKLTRFDAVDSAKNWITRNQSRYDKELHIGTHRKDGFVVYIFKNHS